MRRWFLAFMSVVLFPPSLMAFETDRPAQASHNADLHRNMRVVSSSPNGRINSDIAFWGNLAVSGNYHRVIGGGFRIFDISQPNSPTLLSEVECDGPQNDPSLWDTDGNGKADLLVLSVDQTMASSQCGAPRSASDDPDGWEGLRFFDISDPAAPRYVKGLYQDCGSHTNTLYPDPARNRLIVLNSSYPLRPGPTCGPVRGPEAGRHPLHGVIQVVEVPLRGTAEASARGAREIAELPIAYPGDPDNRFDPDEHALPGFLDLRACHDIAVFVPLRLVAGACAEQAQLWRLGGNGLPDTGRPLWVYDEPQVDFWHSATFTWDGRVVNFIDESFGTGCPTRTPGLGQTGRMYFLDTATGRKFSDFMIAPRDGDREPSYCSAHLGNVVPARNRYLLVNAWYTGGVNVVDFTNPRRPREVAFYDRAPNGDNWSAYWYERPRPSGPLTVFANDGVQDPPVGAGFQVFRAAVAADRVGLDHLNPQTQERVVRLRGG